MSQTPAQVKEGLLRVARENKDVHLYPGRDIDKWAELVARQGCCPCDSARLPCPCDEYREDFKYEDEACTCRMLCTTEHLRKYFKEVYNQVMGIEPETKPKRRRRKQQ